MKYSFTKVLILKPQAKLLSLIYMQLPDFNWRSVSRNKLDLTAYIINDYIDEESMLFALQSSYVKIFQNELAKLIGFKKSKKISLSFFDFLNCFRFEFYNDVKLMQNNFSRKVCIRRQNIIISIASKNQKNLLLCDLCDLLESISDKFLVLPALDLISKNFYRQVVSMTHKLVTNIFGQLRLAYNYL